MEAEPQKVLRLKFPSTMRSSMGNFTGRNHIERDLKGGREIVHLTGSVIGLKRYPPPPVLAVD
jgi:hypothetical protein